MFIASRGFLGGVNLLPTRGYYSNTIDTLLISDIVTRGFGNNLNLVPTRGYNIGSSSVVLPDTHDGAEWHRRKKHQAKLAEDAIYRNAPRPKLKLKTLLEIDQIKPKETLAAREITVAPFIYDIGRMPLANPDQWLLDDDEEAIAWLLQ